MKNLLHHEIGSGDFPPIGAAIVGHRSPELLTVDENGQLWMLASGERKDLVRWSLERGVRVYPELGQLVDDVRRGLALGLLSRVAGRVASPRRGFDAEFADDRIRKHAKVLASIAA